MLKVPTLLLYCSLLCGCGVPDPGHTRIIGHGGLGAEVAQPMNSEAALRGGLERGLDGVELDVQLTADSVLVAYHDQDLSTITGCGGLVNAHTWAELQGHQRCAVMGLDGTTYPIVRLDSLLPALARLHPHADFTLDCKLFAAGDWWPYLHAYANALVKLARIPLDTMATGRHLQGRLLVECQVDDFLLLLQGKQPWLPLYRYGSNAEECIWRAVASRFKGITIHNDRITAEQVALAHGLGLEVAVFGTSGQGAHRKAINKGVDRLQSDVPLLLKR